MLSTYNVLNDLNSIIDAFIEPQYNAKNELSQIQYKEGENNITIKYMVPGATADKIDIQLENNILKVSFTKEEEKSDAKYVRRERTYGSYSKSIKLPYRVDPENINAELKDGILVINLEKAEEAKPRKIEVR
jgi:HSP20 family protein